MELIGLLSIVGWAAALRRWGRVPVECLPLAAVTGIVIVLFPLSMFGLLLPACWLLLIAGLIAVPAMWLRDRAGTMTVLGELAAPPIFVYVAAAVAYRIFFDGIQFYSWDTFAHWGYATQELLYWNTLDRSISNNLESDYPPGINLFHYFILFSAQNSEDRIYFANFLMMAAPLMLLLGRLRNRQTGWVALVVGVAYLFVSAFGLSFRDLPPDHTLGLLFGGAVLYFLRLRRVPKATSAAMVLGLPALAILPLIKEIGIVLALIAATVIVCDIFLRRAAAGAKWNRGYVLIGLLVFTAPLGTWLGWHAYVESLVTKKTFAVGPETVVTAWDVVIGGERTEGRRQTLDRFAAALTGRSIGKAVTGAVINRAYWQATGQWKSGEDFPENTLIPERPVSLAAVAIVFTGLIAVLLFTAPVGLERRRLTATFALMYLGCGGYLLVLLTLYLSAFGDGLEAREVRYFGRYVGTYVIATGLLILSGLADRLAAAETRRVAGGVLIVCLVALVFSSSRMSVSILMRITPEHTDTRSLIRAQTDHAKRVTPDDARIFVVWQTTAGYEHRMLYYDLLPRYVNRGCWSLVRSNGCRIDATGLAARLRSFDYLLLSRSDSYFRERFRELFSDPEEAEPGGKFLFQVVKRPDGGILLESR